MWTASVNAGVALAVQTGSNPRYSGRGGMLAAAGMGFTGLALGEGGNGIPDLVPLENTGGAGTAGAHWRRSVFGDKALELKRGRLALTVERGKVVTLEWQDAEA